MSWAVITPNGNWLVDDFTIEEIDAMVEPYGATWADFEFSPAKNLKMLYEFVAEGHRKKGAEPPARPERYGDWRALSELVTRADLEIPDVFDTDENGASRPLADGEDQTTISSPGSRSGSTGRQPKPAPAGAETSN